MPSKSSSDDESKENYIVNETIHFQQDTIDRLRRINEQAKDAESNGTLTLEDLKRQRGVLCKTLDSADDVNFKLKETRRLQNQLGRWSMKFGRGVVNRANKTRNRVLASTRRKPKKENQSKKEGKKEGKSRKTPEPKKNYRLSFIDTKTMDPDILTGVSPEVREKYRSEFNIMAENDSEIETMLDATTEIIGRLKIVSATMSQEVETQDEALNELEHQMEKANNKMGKVNARARVFVTGR